MKRKTLGQRIRMMVAQRDGFMCRYCDRSFDATKCVNRYGYLYIQEKGRLEFHIDHIKPVSLGGTDEIENLAFSCAKCNLKKSKKYHGKKQND